jgi:hypothetical protein
LATQAQIDQLKAATDKIADGVREAGAAMAAILAPAPAPVPVPVPTPVPTPTPTPAPVPSAIIWQDKVQEFDQSRFAEWGFFPAVNSSLTGTQTVPNGQLGTDADMASIARVRDPAGGPGWALRHKITPTAPGGGRAQYSIASWTNAAFGAQIAKGEIWIEQEMYFPDRPVCTGPGAWLSLMDFHSHGTNGENWWSTDPGLFVTSEAMRSNQPGRFIVRDYSNTIFSNVGPEIPVGRWFKLQTHFPWTTTPKPLTIYVDGVQACQLTCITKAANHTRLQWMSKLYGGNIGGGTWAPNPLIHYTRNVRLGSGPLW